MKLGPAAKEEPILPSPPSKEPANDAAGGRLYDRFFDGRTFVPDSAATKGVADGKGGPFGDGTLPLSNGKPLLNDEQHDFRLKNFFGWDLKGKSGIYGSDFKNKPSVSDVNLLDPSLSDEAIRDVLKNGSATVPSYGSVLSEQELDSIFAFVEGVRSGRLPHPDQVWSLSKGTPGGYRLMKGGDPENGKAIFAQRCAGCHGAQGTKMLLDDGEYSLGSHARQKADEDWFKILNGQPFTKMKRLVRGTSGQELAQEVLDILAALCDRAAFPLGSASKADVDEGDVRCGDYLR